MGGGRKDSVLSRKVSDSASDENKFEQKPEGKEGTTQESGQRIFSSREEQV